MTRAVATVALLLFFLTPTASAAVAVKGDLAVGEYDLVRLTADGLPAGIDPLKAVRWKVSGVPSRSVFTHGASLVFCAPAGRYSVGLRVVDFKRETVEEVDVEVVVRGGTTPPRPDPKPLPPVPPARAWAVCIEETRESLASRGALYGSRELNDWLKAKGWKMRPADKDAVGPDGKPPRDLLPYFKLAKDAARPYPQLFIVDQDGRIRHRGEMPTTAAGLLAILKRVGGP